MRAFLISLALTVSFGLAFIFLGSISQELHIARIQATCSITSCNQTSKLCGDTLKPFLCHTITMEYVLLDVPGEHKKHLNLGYVQSNQMCPEINTVVDCYYYNGTIDQTLTTDRLDIFRKGPDNTWNHDLPLLLGLISAILCVWTLTNTVIELQKLCSGNNGDDDGSTYTKGKTMTTN
jgi:hypothetical protein